MTVKLSYTAATSLGESLDADDWREPALERLGKVPVGGGE